MNNPPRKKMPHYGLAKRIAQDAGATGCIILTFHSDRVVTSVNWFDESTINKDVVLNLFERIWPPAVDLVDKEKP